MRFCRSTAKSKTLCECGFMGCAIDMIGKKYGMLTVLSRADDKITGSGKPRRMYNCECECGKLTVVRGDWLRSGEIKSCGCQKDPERLIGIKFGRLTVLRRVENKVFRNSQHVVYECVCECGNNVNVSGGHLSSGHTRSCGCIKSEILYQRNTTHGGSYTRLYYVWNNMIRRCYDSRSHEYSNYGGRGIKVCDEWRCDFVTFRDWALQKGYNENAKRGDCTLDRIDVNGNYCPSNCRWANSKVQANNKRFNTRVGINGEYHTVSEWCDIYGIKSNIVWTRVGRGWDLIEAIITPPRVPRKANLLEVENDERNSRC